MCQWNKCCWIGRCRWLGGRTGSRAAGWRRRLSARRDGEHNRAGEELSRHLRKHAFCRTTLLSPASTVSVSSGGC